MLGRTYPVYTGCGEEDSLKQFIRNSPQPEAEAHPSLAYLYKKVIAITKQHLLECGIVCSYYMTEAQHSGEWKQDDPYKLADRDFEIKYTASCMCGEVEYAVNSDPVSAKYCHCTDCQRLHGAPFQWAALFHKESLRFVKGVDSLTFYYSPDKEEEHHLPCKVSCSKCHSPIADEGRKMWMAFPTLFKTANGKLPEAFKATCHIFYKDRRLDIKDGTPKWSELKNKSEQMEEAQ